VSSLLVIIHILVCFVLIVAVLLQSGKAADLAGAFGGVGSQTVFGARGAGTLLSKMTTICAILFMITSLALWFVSSKGTKSVIKEEKQTTQPAEVTETKKKPTEEKAQAQAPEKKQEKEQKSTEPVKK
jgi:preprotein translocase subunit SecG